MQETGPGLTTIFLVFTALMLLLSVGVVIFVVIYQRRVMNQRMQMQQLEADHQKDLLMASLQTQERERQRIAKDLHDEIGAMLSAVKMNVNLVERRLKKQGNEETGLDHSRAMIDQAIGDVRRISHELMPPSLEKLGLAAALKEFLEKIQAATQVETPFLASGFEKRLAPQTELALYRIVQESVNNALKHAEATRTEVKLVFGAQNIYLVIEDDGKGFNAPVAQQQGGLGLKSLESRAGLVGGTLNIESVPGKGTIIRITLPHE